MYENNLPAITLSNTDTPTQSKLWLWLGLGIAGYYLLKGDKNKKKPVEIFDAGYEDVDEEEPSMTPSDLHGLNLGFMRSGATDKVERQEQREILKELYPDYYAPRHDAFVERFNREEESRKMKDYMANRGITKGQMTLFGGLSGSLRTCDAWFQTTDKRGKSVNRCFIYKPSCNTKKCKADTNIEMQGYTATCKLWTKNRLGHKQCKSYAPTCKLPTDECRDVPAPLPYREMAVRKRTAKDTEQETVAVAQMLADEANDDLRGNKALLREVISAGGIAPHKSGFMSEEYKYLPAKYKREKGVPMDELAQELNMTENELADKIYMAEAQFRMLKEMRGGSTTVKFKSDDFLDEAVQRMSSGRGFMGIGHAGSTGKSPFTQHLKSETDKEYMARFRKGLFEFMDKLDKEDRAKGVEPWNRRKKMIFQKDNQMTLFGMSRKQLNSIMGIGV